MIVVAFDEQGVEIVATRLVPLFPKQPFPLQA